MASGLIYDPEGQALSGTIQQGEDATINDLVVNGDALIKGSLQVLGAQTIIDSTQIQLEDPIIDVNRSGTAVPETGFRFMSPTGAPPNLSLIYDVAASRFEAGIEGAEKPFAFRSAAPTNGRIAVWNDANKEFETPAAGSIVDLTVTNSLKLGATVQQIDLDGTLAADSDLRLASQKATKTYADGIGSGTFPDQTTVFYVNKSGDATDGLTIGKAFPSIQTALAAAAATDFVFVTDGGVYAENITIPASVKLFAPNATLNGNISMGSGASVTLRAHNPTGPTAVTLTAGQGYYRCEALSSTGAITDFASATSTLYAHVDQISKTTGAICDSTGMTGSLQAVIGAIIVTGVTAAALFSGAVGSNISVRAGLITQFIAGSIKLSEYSLGASSTQTFAVNQLNATQLSDINANCAMTVTANVMLGTLTNIGAALPDVLSQSAYGSTFAGPVSVSDITSSGDIKLRPGGDNNNANVVMEVEPLPETVSESNGFSVVDDSAADHGLFAHVRYGPGGDTISGFLGMFARDGSGGSWGFNEVVYAMDEDIDRTNGIVDFKFGFSSGRTATGTTTAKMANRKLARYLHHTTEFASVTKDDEFVFNNNINGGKGLVMTEAAAVPAPPAATKGILWTKSTMPSTLMFTDDVGTDHTLALNAAAYGDMFVKASAVVNNSYKQGTPHLYVDAGLALNLSDNVSLEVGKAAAYTAVADNGGNSQIATVGHALAAGDVVSFQALTGDVTIDGVHTVLSVDSANLFTVDFAWPGATSTGEWQHGHGLIAATAGIYKVNASITFETQGGGGEIAMTVYKDALAVDALSSERKTPGGSDIGHMTISGFISVTAGQTLRMAIQNNNSNNEVLVQDCNISVHRIIQ